MLDSQKFYINIFRNITIYIDEYCFTIKLYCTGPAIGQPQHLLPQPLTDLHYLTAKCVLFDGTLFLIHNESGTTTNIEIQLNDIEILIV